MTDEGRGVQTEPPAVRNVRLRKESDALPLVIGKSERHT